MRILHLPHGYWPATGGAEHLTQGWSEGLAGLGHTVQASVADLRTPEGLYRFGIPKTGHQAEESHNGVTIHRLSLHSGYRLGSTIFRRNPYAPQPFGDHLRARVHAQLKRDLRQEILRFRPDVVLALPHLFENVRAVFELRHELQFPLFWAPLLHESDPNWPFDEVRELVHAVDGLITLTQWEATRLIDRYGAKADRIHVVPPGVSLPSPQPDVLGEPPMILYLGRLSKSKGIDVLPSVLQSLWNRAPETRLVIAGATTADLPQIRARFAELDPPAKGQVQFRTDITERSKQRLLHAATALVLPSERESFGIVLLEAWAATTPVVTVDSPIFRGIVRDGVDGFLVPARDSGAFSTALLQLINDTEKAHAMGLAGLTRVKNEFTWERASQLLYNAYKSSLGHI